MDSKIVFALDEKVNNYQLEDLFNMCNGKVHSIKINSMYHYIEPHILKMLVDKYSVDVFYDIKLYDTPKTVYDTIKRLPSSIKYITVAFAHHNHDSLRAAIEAGIDYSKDIFIVSVLTSVNIVNSSNCTKAAALTSSYCTDNYMKNTYDYTAKQITELNNEYKCNKLGMVVPINYIKGVKACNNDIVTLTPGLSITSKQLVNYKHQVSTGLVEDAAAMGGDLFVLGRHFPTTIKELDELNEKINMIG